MPTDTVLINGNPFAADLVTLPDGTPGVFVARDKIGYGADGQYRDVDPENPLPTIDAAVAAAIAQLAIALETVTVGGTVAIDAASTIKTRQAGTYGYAAGTSVGTVDVPIAARLSRVSVIAGISGATIAIGAGATITIPANGSFDEQIPGEALGADVVIAGSVQSYYVAWVI